MKIVVCNGSPRRNGNTAAFCGAFEEEAVRHGHQVTVIPVGTMKIAGCVGCETCHHTGGGCVVEDEMQKLYPLFKEAQMVVLASPIYYFGFSSQLAAMMSRWYPTMKPKAKKYALILSAYSEGAYQYAEAQYHKMVADFGAEDCGTLMFYGKKQRTEENLERVRTLAASL